MKCPECEANEAAARVCENNKPPIECRADTIKYKFANDVRDECAGDIRALRAGCKCETVSVPRELRDLLDTVSALDTFNIENPRDFSRMPSYIQVVHKRLFKEWGIVRPMLTAAKGEKP